MGNIRFFFNPFLSFQFYFYILKLNYRTVYTGTLVNLIYTVVFSKKNDKYFKISLN